jgi:hypothetical protein
MAVQFEGGVVIGADSRTTTGSYIVSQFTFRDKLEADLSLSDDSTTLSRLLLLPINA